MNLALVKEIVSHIYSHFAIIPSNFVNLDKTSSLMDPFYLLNERISFEVEGEPYHGKVWGCQMSIGQQEIKILLGDCALDKNYPEFVMIVQPKDAPAYGLYFIYINPAFDDTPEPIDFQPMIAVSPDKGKGWLQCNAHLQATFLAAMEQARELRMPWEKCTDYKPLYQCMINFLKFHLEIYGE
jgi:hypothetical protein